jgi:hypothetical protein
MIRDGFLDWDCWLLRSFRRRCRRHKLLRACKCGISFRNEPRQIFHRELIVKDVGGDDLARQRKKSFASDSISCFHFPPPTLIQLFMQYGFGFQ